MQANGSWQVRTVRYVSVDEGEPVAGGVVRIGARSGEWTLRYPERGSVTKIRGAQHPQQMHACLGAQAQVVHLRLGHRFAFDQRFEWNLRRLDDEAVGRGGSPPNRRATL